MGLRRIITLGVLVLGVVIVALGFRLVWVEYNGPYRLAGSSVARWWRCQNVERPMLEEGTPWTLTYSWSGLMGPGEVSLVLESGGRATLTSSRHDQPSPLVAGYTVAHEEISRVALKVDRTGLLCETTHYRDGYIVWDLGRFSITITTGNFSRTVYVDECNTLDDPAALFEIRAALIALKPPLNDSIGWASEGTASVPAQICAPWNQGTQ